MEKFDRVENWCLYRILLYIFLCFDQNTLNGKYEWYLPPASFIERSLLYKLYYLLWFSILKQRYEICCIINRRIWQTDFLTECYLIYQSVLRKIQGGKSRLLYFSVLPCTSLYFFVLLTTSYHFFVLFCTSWYFCVLLCTSVYFLYLSEVLLFPPWENLYNFYSFEFRPIVIHGFIENLMLCKLPI